MDWENQKMLETFFNAKQTPLLLRRELLASNSVITAISRSGLDEEFALDLLSQMILHKRATVPTMVGLLRGHFKDKTNPFQACADELHLACLRDLIDFAPRTEQFIIKFDLDQKTHDLMRQYQYMPPMIVPPLEVDGNRGSGYITIRHDSLILKDNHHDGDLAIDAINNFNNIPLCINVNVVKGIRNSWKNLDKPKDGEGYQQYRERVIAFERYEKDSFFTISLMLEMGNEFWMTHKYDKRGRVYSQGYHINPQGNCWNKSVLEFADQELVSG